MKAGPLMMSALLASSALLAFSASAHDPKDFDRMLQAAKAQSIPTTCAELATRYEYSSDADNLEITELKVHCAAEKAAAMKTSTAVKKAAATKTK